LPTVNFCVGVVSFGTVSFFNKETFEVSKTIGVIASESIFIPVFKPLSLHAKIKIRRMPIVIG
jgi:hypothetical protein